MNSAVSDSMHTFQRQVERIKAFKCKLGQSYSTVPSRYATLEASPVEEQTSTSTEGHTHCHLLQTHTQADPKSTHLFRAVRHHPVLSGLFRSDSAPRADRLRNNSHPPHSTVQTARCYRCTDKWKEGGGVSHEINKRGREGGEEAGSLNLQFNFILGPFFSSVSEHLLSFSSSCSVYLLLFFNTSLSIFLPMFSSQLGYLPFLEFHCFFPGFPSWFSSFSLSH